MQQTSRKFWSECTDVEEPPSRPNSESARKLEVSLLILYVTVVQLMAYYVSQKYNIRLIAKTLSSKIEHFGIY